MNPIILRAFEITYKFLIAYVLLSSLINSIASSKVKGISFSVAGKKVSALAFARLTPELG